MRVHRISFAVITLYTLTTSSAPATTSWDESEELDVRGLFSSSKGKDTSKSSTSGSSSSSGQCQKATTRGIDFDVDIIKRLFGSGKPTICGVTAAPSQQSCKSFSADETSNGEQTSTSGGHKSNQRRLFGSSRTQTTQMNGDSTGYTPLDPKLSKTATSSAKKLLLALQKQSSTCDNAVELPLLDKILQENRICEAFTAFSKVIQPSSNPFSKKAKALVTTWLEDPIALANGKSAKSSTAASGSRGSTSKPSGLRSRVVPSSSGSATASTGEGNNFWKVEPSVYKSKKAIAIKALDGTSSTASSTTESADEEGASVAEYLSNSQVQESEKAFAQEFAAAVWKAVEEAYQQAKSCGKKDKSKVEAQWAKVKSAKMLVQHGIDHYFEAMVTAAGAEDSEAAAEEPIGGEEGAPGSDGEVQADPTDPESSGTLDDLTTDPTTGTSDGTSGPDTGLDTQEPDGTQQSIHSSGDNPDSGSTGGKGGQDSTESGTGNEEFGSSQSETGNEELNPGSGGTNSHGSGHPSGSQDGAELDGGETSDQGGIDQGYSEEEPIEEPTEEY